MFMSPLYCETIKVHLVRRAHDMFLKFSSGLFLIYFMLILIAYFVFIEAKILNGKYC